MIVVILLFLFFFCLWWEFVDGVLEDLVVVLVSGDLVWVLVHLFGLELLWVGV